MEEKKYTRTEIARALRVSSMTVFRWEKAGKIPAARRNPTSNYRTYTEADLKKLRKITGR